MIQHLHIKNMALIEELELDLTEGLNVLTGETGAGKSIILESVEAAIGGRAGKDLLKDGEESGLVELVFSLEPETVLSLRAFEKEQDMDLSIVDDELIISRRIYANKSVNRINDATVSVAMLKTISAFLLDIHSQAEHQSLTKEQTHLTILDRSYPEADSLLEEVGASFKQWNEAKKELDSLNLDSETKNRMLSLAKYEIDEIEEADLKEDEEEGLEAEYKRLQAGEDVMERLSEIHGLLTGAGQAGAIDQIGSALSLITEASEKTEEVSGLYEQLETIDSLLSDLLRDLNDKSRELEYDPETLNTITKRLDLIRRLEAKYGRTISDILAYLEERKAEYARLLDADAYREELLKQVEEYEKQYERCAKKLSKKREEAAVSLAKRITEALTDLNFLNVDFSIELIKREKPSELGLESARFMISTNVGETKKPLSQVASGGELSRIMLAIKSCLASEDHIPTLIFDEIDTGISGRTAQKVSEKLANIASAHQVICISHLPQIAAMADSHYRIEKKVTDGRTVTEVFPLGETEIVDELARMLGGAQITDAVRENAQEMLSLAKAIKKKTV